MPTVSKHQQIRPHQSDNLAKPSEVPEKRH